MSVLVKVEGVEAALEKAQQRLQGVKGGIDKAAMRSINRALAQGKTELSRAIRDRYTIGASEIKDTVHVRNATQSSLEGALVSRGGGISAGHFKHSPRAGETTGANRKQIRVEIIKGQRKAYKTGFKWDGGWGTGKSSIYIRTGQKIVPTKGYHKGKKYKVEKIKKVTSASMPEMAGNEGVSERVRVCIQESFEMRMEHETLRLLDKKGG